MRENQLFKINSRSLNKTIAYSDQILFTNNPAYGTIMYMTAYGYYSNLKSFKPVPMTNTSPSDVIKFGPETNVDSYYLVQPGRTYGSSFIIRNNTAFNLKIQKIVGSELAKSTISMNINKRPFDRESGIIYVPLKDIFPDGVDIKEFKDQLIGGSSILKAYVLSSPRVQHEMFKFLKKNCTVPILEEWMTYILDNDRYFYLYLPNAYYADLESENNIYGFSFSYDSVSIRETISMGLRSQILKVRGTNQVSKTMSNIHNLTQYLEHFSNQLINKSTEKFEALYDPDKDTFTEKEKSYFEYTEYAAGMNFFNAQRNSIAAIARGLNMHRSVVVCGEMGVGYYF